MKLKKATLTLVLVLILMSSFVLISGKEFSGGGSMKFYFDEDRNLRLEFADRNTYIDLTQSLSLSPLFNKAIYYGSPNYIEITRALSEEELDTALVGITDPGEKQAFTIYNDLVEGLDNNKLRIEDQIYLDEDGVAIKGKIRYSVLFPRENAMDVSFLFGEARPDTFKVSNVLIDFSEKRIDVYENGFFVLREYLESKEARIFNVLYFDYIYEFVPQDIVNIDAHSFIYENQDSLKYTGSAGLFEFYSLEPSQSVIYFGKRVIILPQLFGGNFYIKEKHYADGMFSYQTFEDDRNDLSRVKVVVSDRLDLASIEATTGYFDEEKKEFIACAFTEEDNLLYNVIDSRCNFYFDLTSKGQIELAGLEEETTKIIDSNLVIFKPNSLQLENSLDFIV